MGPNKSRDKDSPRPFRRVDELGNFLTLDGKLSLKVDEPQVGQRHEDVERNSKYYHIVIFPERA